MRNKALQNLLLSLQCLIMVALLGLATQGVTQSGDIASTYKFAECAVRIIVLFVFTVFYYSSFADNSRPDSVFMPMFLFFSALSEVRILSTSVEIFNMTFIPLMVTVDIHIFATIAMVAMVIGYGLYYHESGFSKANAYLAASLFSSLAVTMVIPRSQTVDYVWNSSFLLVFLIALTVIALVVYIRLVFSEPAGPQLVRHFSVMALCLSSFINVCFDSIILNIVGTGIYFATCLIVMFMTKKSAIQF